MAEETQKHRDLVDDLERFELGTGPTNAVEEEKILLNTIALGNDNRFNEHQSTSLGPDDLVVAGPVLHTVLDQVGATTSPFPAVNPQTADVILARAQAGTCAGCHMTSPNEVVREIPNEPDVVWPEVAAGGFVHVREADRMLSPALENHFLPVRRYILGATSARRPRRPKPSPARSLRPGSSKPQAAG
jgi:hypothetical protein